MIRTVATLFARKTATVAVVGAVVLGGATLALADTSFTSEDAPDGEVELSGPSAEQCAADPDLTGCEPDEEQAAPADKCPADDDGTTAEDDLEAGTDGEDFTAAEAEDPCDDESGEEEAGDDVSCDDPANAEHEDCVTEAPTGDGDVDVDENEETGTTEDDPAPTSDVVEEEHPNAHGKRVSAAARGEEGSGCEGMTGRDKGQCVSAIARGEEPAAGTDTKTEARTEEESAPVVDEAPEAEAQTSPAPKGNGKGNAGGNGKGKGKG